MRPNDLFPVFVLLAVPAAAQEPTPALPVALAEAMLVPIHTHPPDPVGGEYGIWAAGPGYKASFHDGFAFYPCLGPTAPRHLPLRWHTEAVTAGAASLLGGDARESYGEYRFERRSGDVVEAYKVRADGVEQTFTLLRRPEVEGDLVITGRIDTPLACAAVSPAPRELVFTAAGKNTVRYGRALAVDANGQRTDVATGWDGARLRLVLDQRIVQQAAYPLTIDPLTSATVLRQDTLGYPLPVPAITAETTATGPRLVFAFVRPSTATDLDVYALITRFDLSGGIWLYQDITASWSSRGVDATYVGGSAKWALSFERDFGSSTNVRIYLHDAASIIMNSGTTLFPSAPTGIDQKNASIGGSMFGTLALVAFERVDPASGFAGAWAMRVDATGATLLTPFGFTGGFLEQLLRPRVTPMTFSSTGWVVALAGNTTLRVARVPHSGSGSVPTSALVTESGGVHVVGGLPGLPAFSLAGTQGRYLLAYASTQQSGTLHIDRLRALRFDWAPAAASPTVLADREFASATAVILSALSVQVGGCEYDQVTASHWALGYATPSFTGVARFGHQGGVTESQSVSTGTNVPSVPDVAFARPGLEGTFAIAYADLGAANSLRVVGREFAYPTDAISSVYGTSCGSGVSSSTNHSLHQGHEFFQVSLTGLSPATLAIYVFGLSPGNMDLTPQGLPGCFLNVGLPTLGNFVAISDGTGRATISYALPDVPLFIGDVYSQWFYYDASASPQPFRSYRGVRHQVR